MATPQSVINAAAQRRAEKATAQGDTELAARNTALIKGVPETAEVPTTPARDLAAEAETVSAAGFVPTTDQEKLDAAFATYGTNLPPEFQAIKDAQDAQAAKLDSLQGGGVENAGALKALGGEISATGQTASDYEAWVSAQKGQLVPQLNILQDALKMTSGVGSQPLGTSDVFAQAGVGGYGALTASLNARRDEMNYKKESFVNAVNKIAGFQYGENARLAADAAATLKKYEMLANEYQFEQSRIDKISADAQAYEQQLDLMDRQFNNEMSLLDYKAGLDAAASNVWTPSFDANGNFVGIGNGTTGNTVGSYSTYLSPDGTITTTPGTSTASGERVVLGVQGQDGVAGAEFANNCVKYLRTLLPNLPYGLWDINDKAAAVNPSIGKDQGQVGYGLLTAEGPYGHATYITGVDQENRQYILREANYTPGVITEGRRLSFDSPLILGLVAPNAYYPKGLISEGQVMADAVGQGEGFTSGINNALAVKYEGMNPTGAETFTPSTNYSDADLYNTYKQVLNKIVKVDNKDRDSIINNNLNTFLMDYISNGDYDGARQQILDMSISDYAAAEQSQITGREVAKTQLLAIKDMMKDYTDAGGKFGIFKGKIEDVAKYLGGTTDPKLAAIANSISDALFTYRNTISGAAFGEQEAADYANLFPSIANTYEKSTSSIDSMLNTMGSKNRALLGIKMGGVSNYDKLFSLDTLNSERGYDDETAKATQEAMADYFRIGL